MPGFKVFAQYEGILEALELYVVPGTNRETRLPC